MNPLLFLIIVILQIVSASSPTCDLVKSVYESNECCDAKGSKVVKACEQPSFHSINISDEIITKDYIVNSRRDVFNKEEKNVLVPSGNTYPYRPDIREPLNLETVQGVIFEFKDGEIHGDIFKNEIHLKTIFGENVELKLPSKPYVQTKTTIKEKEHSLKIDYDTLQKKFTLYLDGDASVSDSPLKLLLDKPADLTLGLSTSSTSDAVTNPGSVSTTGVKHTEITGFALEAAVNTNVPTVQEVTEFKAQYDAAGLKIHSLLTGQEITCNGVNYNFLVATEEQVNCFADAFFPAMKYLGMQYIRFDPPSASSLTPAELKSAIGVEDTKSIENKKLFLDKIAPVYRALSEKAVLYNIVVTAENHLDVIITPELMLYLKEKVSHENFGLVLDFNNWGYGEYTREELTGTNTKVEPAKFSLEVAPHAYALCGKIIGYQKTETGDDNIRWNAYGEQVDVVEVVKAFVSTSHRTKYDSIMMLEPEYQWGGKFENVKNDYKRILSQLRMLEPFKNQDQITKSAMIIGGDIREENMYVELSKGTQSFSVEADIMFKDTLYDIMGVHFGTDTDMMHGFSTFYAPVGSKFVDRNRLGAEPGGILDFEDATKKQYSSMNEWHKIRVTNRRGRITIYLNGEVLHESNNERYNRYGMLYLQTMGDTLLKHITTIKYVENADSLHVPYTLPESVTDITGALAIGETTVATPTEFPDDIPSDEYAVGRVEIYWEIALARDFLMEVSDDGVNFKPVYYQPGLYVKNSWDAYPSETTHPLLTADGRTDGIAQPESRNKPRFKMQLDNIFAVGKYLRLRCLTRATPWGCSIFEFESYDRSGKKIPMRVVSQSSLENPSYADYINYLVDGDRSTRISTLFQDNQYTTVELGRDDYDKELVKIGVKIPLPTWYDSQYKLLTLDGEHSIQDARFGRKGDTEISDTGIVTNKLVSEKASVKSSTFGEFTFGHTFVTLGEDGNMLMMPNKNGKIMKGIKNYESRVSTQKAHGLDSTASRPPKKTDLLYPVGETYIDADITYAKSSGGLRAAAKHPKSGQPHFMYSNSKMLGSSAMSRLLKHIRTECSVDNSTCTPHLANINMHTKLRDVLGTDWDVASTTHGYNHSYYDHVIGDSLNHVDGMPTVWARPYSKNGDASTTKDIMWFKNAENNFKSRYVDKNFNAKLISIEPMQVLGTVEEFNYMSDYIELREKEDPSLKEQSAWIEKSNKYNKAFSNCQTDDLGQEVCVKNPTYPRENAKRMFAKVTLDMSHCTESKSCFLDHGEYVHLTVGGANANRFTGSYSVINDQGIVESFKLPALSENSSFYVYIGSAQNLWKGVVLDTEISNANTDAPLMGPIVEEFITSLPKTLESLDMLNTYLTQTYVSNASTFDIVSEYDASQLSYTNSKILVSLTGWMPATEIPGSKTDTPVSYFTNIHQAYEHFKSSDRFTRHSALVGHHGDAALGLYGPWLRPRSGEANWYYYYEFGKRVDVEGDDGNPRPADYHEVNVYKAFDINFADGLMEIIASLLPEQVDTQGIRHMSTREIFHALVFAPLDIVKDYEAFPSSGTYPYSAAGIALKTEDHNRWLMAIMRNIYTVDANDKYTDSPQSIASTKEWIDDTLYKEMVKPVEQTMVTVSGEVAGNPWWWAGVPVGLEITFGANGQPNTGYWPIDLYYGYVSSVGLIATKWKINMDHIFADKLARKNILDYINKKDPEVEYDIAQYSMSIDMYPGHNLYSLNWGSGTGYVQRCFNMESKFICGAISFHSYSPYNLAEGFQSYFEVEQSSEKFLKYETNTFIDQELKYHFDIEQRL